MRQRRRRPGVLALPQVHGRLRERLVQGHLSRTPVGSGPPALNGANPIATSSHSRARGRGVSRPVLWGTDWPYPNLKDHMPDDALGRLHSPYRNSTDLQDLLCTTIRCGSIGLRKGELIHGARKPIPIFPARPSSTPISRARATGPTSLHVADEAREPAARFKADERSISMSGR